MAASFLFFSCWLEEKAKRGYLSPEHAMPCERMAGVVMDDAVQTIYLDRTAQWLGTSSRGAWIARNR